MCGINGIVQLRGPGDAPHDRARIGAMNSALRHRGPDDEGSHIAPGIALGFCRLAIVDPSPAGHQPMLSDDGMLALVFNGELYNHIEIAAELRALGCRFRSRSDSEVVLQAYATWGEACLQRFNGMWALAVWDARRRRLFAARDRFGVKPFVYTECAGELLFSSEAAGLRAVLPLHRANLGKLHDLLAYGYRRNDGETFYEGVHELPPAHRMIVEDGRVTLSRWWSLPDERAPGALSEHAALLRETLADAVRLRLRSDVPVALLQSGGLDSSAIATLVDDELARQRPAGAAVTAFSVVHPGHAEDESAAIDALMQRCPRLHSVRLVPQAADLAAELPAFVQTMQEPVFGPTAYAHWLTMRAVHARGIKVMLNGQGADEALAGYGHYLTGYRVLDLALAQPWRVPGEMWAHRQLLGQPLGMQLAQLGKALLGRRRTAALRARFSEGTTRVLAASFHAAHRERLEAGAMHVRSDNLCTHLRRQLLNDGFNQILHYEDQSSMSQSIEMRSPFVDWRVMTLAFALADDERMSRGVTKRVLREAFGERLPPGIVGQHRKIGFATPFAAWAREASFQSLLREVTASASFRARSLWRADALAARMLRSDAVASGFPLWRFVCTELWLRQAGITNA